MTKKKPKPSPASRRGLSKSATWLLLAALAAGGALYARYGEREEIAALAPGAASIEMIAEGERLFVQHCTPCHGPGGRGQEPERPMGGLTDAGILIAPALNGTAHTWHHAPDALFQIVRQGSPAPESPMKGFAGKMTDLEIQGVLAYVMSLWPPDLRERYDRMVR